MNAVAPLANLTEKLKLRVENFELLEESGAFAAYSKAELIDGDIYIVNSQYARHGLTKSRLFVELAQRLREAGAALDAYSEVSIRLASDSMPEPDIFIAPTQAFGIVPAAGVLLVVEVADTTIATDLGRKAQLYAAAGIPEYWVIDVSERRIVTHRQPGASGYGERAEAPYGLLLRSAAIEGLAVDTSVLPA